MPYRNSSSDPFELIGRISGFIMGNVLGLIHWDAVAQQSIITIIGIFLSGVGGFLITWMMQSITRRWRKP